MTYKHHIPPCDGDCFNCRRPENKCYGGNPQKSPYATGTQPRRKIGHGDFGAVRVVEPRGGIPHK